MRAILLSQFRPVGTDHCDDLLAREVEAERRRDRKQVHMHDVVGHGGGAVEGHHWFDAAPAGRTTSSIAGAAFMPSRFERLNCMHHVTSRGEAVRLRRATTCCSHVRTNNGFGSIRTEISGAVGASAMMPHRLQMSRCRDA